MFSPTCVRETETPRIVNPQGYVLDNLEIRVRFSAAGEALFFSKAPTPVAGHTQSHIQSVSGTIFSGIIQPGREAWPFTSNL